MKKIVISVLLAALALIPAMSQNNKNPFLGRWDLTVTAGDMKYPSWLEVKDNAGTLEVRAQQRTGNVAPVAAAKMDGQRLVVTVLAAAATRPELIWDLTEKGGKISGVSRQADVTWQMAGVPAPALKRAAPAAWGAPESLFNGKDRADWQGINNTPDAVEGHFTDHWTVKNGELTNEARGSNLRTTRTFTDFKLHVEYNCPQEENSGIYLRGRYEVQVGPPRLTPPSAQPAGARKGGGGGGGYRNPYGGVGSIYGMLGPASPPPFNPEWQVYDITLVGRMATVVFNGVTTIDNQEIAGVTGGAIDSHEGEAGPIYLQGDHHGGIRYRSITISLPKK